MIRKINTAVARRREELQNGENDKGFTLIELMVVIIIIGILAAIAIPVFLNQRQQAWDSSVKSDLGNAAIAAESYSVANNGSYAGLTYSTVASTGVGTGNLPGFKKGDDNIINCPTVTVGTAYVCTGKNKNSDTTYTLTTGKITP